MGRIAYVNGRFVPQMEATVHIEDRGYQLADAVYEVWSLFDGRLADAEGHFTRRQIKQFEQLTIAVNAAGRGDQIGVLLRPLPT